MRRLIECIPVSVVVIDRQGTILSINRTPSGGPVEDALGRSCFEFLPESIRDESREALTAAFRSGKHAQFEFEWPPGRWCEAQFAPIEDGSTASVGVVIMNDITERRRADDRARRRLAELAHVHRVNTMGTMVSELAHEINQPLYAIANFAEASALAIRKGRPAQDEQLLAWLAAIAEQANRAGTIVRRLGRLVRTDPAERIEVDLNRLIVEVIELARLRLCREDVDVVFHAAEDLPPVVVDPVQIEQVVVNLVQNAMEAIVAFGARERRVRVETFHRGERGVEVRVADSAAAALPEDLETLFEPFFTTKPEGMGMGLAICRSIIEDHGGRIWAVRDPAGGAGFSFLLPLGDSESHRG